MKILVLGAGKKGKSQHEPDVMKSDVVVTVDAYQDAHVKHDLNVLPWPFKAGEFDQVFASHILEHLDPVKLPEIMNEIARVLKVGGGLVVYVPHFREAIAHTHPTHFKSFGYSSFDYFCVNTPGFEKYGNKFRLLYKELLFGPLKRKYLFAFVWIAGEKPQWYEDGFASILVPPHEVYLHLERM